MPSELTAIRSPAWLSAKHRRRWHELFLDPPIDLELGAGIYRELAERFGWIISTRGNTKPYGKNGYFVMVREAKAVMLQLKRALGPSLWRATDYAPGPPVPLSRIRYAGLWKSGRSYDAGDVARLGFNLFIATRRTANVPGAPSSAPAGDDWSLFMRGDPEEPMS